MAPGVHGGGGAFAAHDGAPRHAYRGVWVPDAIDEARAAFSTSIASYSRTMQGVCGVLDFYASLEGTEAAATAAKYGHVLVFVLRCWRDSEWVVPVQFFSDALIGPQEKELVLPPFTALEFHDEFSIVVDRGAPSANRDAALAELARPDGWRWSPCPTMAALLKGDQVELEQGMFGGKPMHARITKLTLRFVRAVEVAAPVRELLDPAAPLLYGFPG